MKGTVPSTQSILFRTIQDLQERSEVEAVVSEIITDVEVSCLLHERLQQHHKTSQLQHHLQEYENAVEEIRAVHQEQANTQKRMADALVEELVQLSQELGQLKEIKEQHDQLLMDYDGVVAKLLQAEDNLVEERERCERLQDDIALETRYQKETEADSKPPAVNFENSIPDTTPRTEQVQDNDKDDDVEKSKQAPSVPTLASQDAVAALRPRETETISEEDDEGEVVALDVDADEDGLPSLDELDTEILTKIFAFLDALDILNMAQINVCMYSRVDSLFNAGTTDTTDNSTIASMETQTPAVTSVPVSDTTTPSTTATSKATATTASTGTTPTISSQHSPPPQPTMVALPPPVSQTTKLASKQQAVSQSHIPPPQSSSVNSPATAQHAPSKSIDSASGLGILSSLLQPRNRGSSQPSTPTRSYHRTTSAPSSDAGQPLNAAIANSLASKLSDAELNAIILMTERLKRAEQMVEKLTKENEDLAAKLDGTEGVKQFLIAKVRDMESSITSSVENEVKVAQQIASDQEVIAFLDSRVQDLEREGRIINAEKQKFVEEVERVQQQAMQKATVMGDMLQFEREKLKDGEREWKATKKLLIKEVKSCRAQILTLQAERDGYREQNETLHKAIGTSLSSSVSYGRDHFFTS